MLRMEHNVATKLRSLQSTYKALKGRGSATSHLSSYAKTLATRTAAAQDKVVDDNYANGLISTQTYLNELQSRSVRLTNTPLQRTNLTIKMKDVQQTYKDEQIQTAYKSGGFYNGQKVDDAFMLAYEQDKLAGMTADSTAYQQQAQKVATLQDKADKAARNEYRLQTQLKLSQSPDASWQIMQQKADMYQQLADQAKSDGDNNQYMSFQTTANNYKESANNAKVSAEYQAKLFETKTTGNKKKSDIQYGTQPYQVPATIPSGNAPNVNQGITPQDNPDGTVTPGQTIPEKVVQEPQAGILDDISNIDWNDLTPYYTESDLKSIRNVGKSLDDKQKAIQKKIEDAQMAFEKSGAAQDAMDSSTTYDEKLKYAREMSTQSSLYENYVKEADQLNEEFGTASTDASLVEEKKRIEVANRIIADKQNKIDLAIDTLNQDVLNGDVSKEDFAVSNAELINAKKSLFDLGTEVFSNSVPDETKRIDFTQKSESLANEVNTAQAYISNFPNFELIMDADTGKVAPKFVASDKAMNKDANGKVLPDGQSAFNVKYQQVGNAYVPVQFRDKKSGKVLTPTEVQSMNLSELSNPNKFVKEGTVWRSVVHEEVDAKGNVTGETVERSPINATFGQNGEILDYSYTDTVGQIHNMTDIPIQEANPQQGFLEKAGNWIKNAVSNVGDYVTNNPLNNIVGVGNTPSPLNPLRSIVENAPQIGSDLRSLQNPFEIQKAYAAGGAQNETPTMNGVPTEYAPTIIAAANKYGINPSTLAGLLAQESWDFNPKYVSGYHTDGTGRGIAAIDLNGHPEITDAQAFDPTFSIDWAAKEVARLQKSKGSEFEALRAYNAGETGSANNADLGKNYANKVLERSKAFTVTTPAADTSNLLASATGLRSQSPLISNVTGTPKQNPLLKSIGDTATDIGTGVQGAMTGAGNAIRSVSSNVSSGAKKVSDTAKKVSNTVRSVAETPKLVQKQVQNNPVVQQAASNVSNFIKNPIKVGTASLKQNAQAAVKTVGNAVSNAYNNIKKKVSSGISGLKSFFKF